MMGGDQKGLGGQKGACIGGFRSMLSPSPSHFTTLFGNCRPWLPLAGSPCIHWYHEGSIGRTIAICGGGKSTNQVIRRESDRPR